DGGGHESTVEEGGVGWGFAWLFSGAEVRSGGGRGHGGVVVGRRTSEGWRKKEFGIKILEAIDNGR
ncbi:MAG: hypothetical protein Q9157_008241, partial [Trypethelium eluteriae]